MTWIFKNRARWQEELLSAYLDGRLTAVEEARVRRLLDTSPQARQELEALRAAVARLREAPRPVTARSFALTPSMVRAPQPKPKPPALRQLMSVATATAAVLLAVSLAGSFGRIGSVSESADKALTSRDTSEFAQPAPAADTSAGAAAAPETPPMQALRSTSEPTPAPEATPNAGSKGPEGGATPVDGSAGTNGETSKELVPDQAIPVRGVTPWGTLSAIFGALTAAFAAGTLWAFRRRRATL